MGDFCTFVLLYRWIRYSVSIGISLEDVVISRFQHRYALKKSKSKSKRNMHRTFCGKMSWVKSNKLLPDMKWCNEIKILHEYPFEKEYIGIYLNIFE